MPITVELLKMIFFPNIRVRASVFVFRMDWTLKRMNSCRLRAFFLSFYSPYSELFTQFTHSNSLLHLLSSYCLLFFRLVFCLFCFYVIHICFVVISRSHSLTLFRNFYFSLPSISCTTITYNRTTAIYEIMLKHGRCVCVCLCAFFLAHVLISLACFYHAWMAFLRLYLHSSWVDKWWNTVDRGPFKLMWCTRVELQRSLKRIKIGFAFNELTSLFNIT